DTVLRANLRKAGVDYAVVKNTLLTLAVKGTALEGLTSVLEGTTALAVSKDDAVASAKILSEFAEKHENFSVKGGFLDGEVISLEKIDSLAKLPSKEVLLATVAAAFQAPMASFARAVNAIFNVSPVEIAKAIGRTRAYVDNRFSVLKRRFIDGVRQWLYANRLVRA
ncbi:MAG: 50S ribosomal protein L10, partial [Muribaculaceae bacterium]|nr:50S ribosomal protein L10 [Muribaculaceae bacterium]